MWAFVRSFCSVSVLVYGFIPGFFSPFRSYHPLGELFVGYLQIKRSLGNARSRRKTADPIRFLLSDGQLHLKSRPRNLLFSAVRAELIV